MESEFECWNKIMNTHRGWIIDIPEVHLKCVENYIKNFIKHGYKHITLFDKGTNYFIDCENPRIDIGNFTGIISINGPFPYEEGLTYYCMADVNNGIFIYRMRLIENEK